MPVPSKQNEGRPVIEGRAVWISVVRILEGGAVQYKVQVRAVQCTYSCAVLCSVLLQISNQSIYDGNSSFSLSRKISISLTCRRITSRPSNRFEGSSTRQLTVRLRL
jgi:hypothetical protein